MRRSSISFREFFWARSLEIILPCDRVHGHHARRRSEQLVGYPSGQRGQTVNLLAHAFDGSNPSPTTTFNFIQ